MTTTQTRDATPPLVEDDDPSIHPASAAPAWREAWWFVFFDHARDMHGIAYVYAYPNQDRGAYIFGLWRDGRAVVFDRDLNAPIRSAGEIDHIGPLRVHCAAPNERWEIVYEGPEASATLHWSAMSPLYDWEWAHLTGSRHYEQSGRMRGEFLLGEEHVTLDGFSQRDRSWGARSFGVVQQCWSSRSLFGEDFYSHQSIVTVNGRDCLFGYVFRDGVLEPIQGLDLEIAYAHRWGPPLRTQARLVDAAGRELTYVVSPETIVSSLICNDKDRVDMHITFSRFAHDGRSAVGHMDHWFSDPSLVRPHLSVHGENMGRLYR
jgi:hypothetical protein